MASAIHVLDGQLLDGEVERRLVEEVGESLGDVGLPLEVQMVKTAFADEIKLALRIVLFKLLVWDRSTTYGFMMQGLRLRVSKLSKLGLAVAILLGYFHEKWESFVYGEGTREGTGEQARRFYLVTLKPFVERYSPLLQLALTLRFLLNGKQSNLTHTLLGIGYEAQSPLSRGGLSDPESVSYEFQNRQLVWNCVSEVLKVLRVWDLVALRGRQFGRGGSSATSNGMHAGRCSSCGDEPTNAVVATPCGDVYCYVCYMKRMTNDVRRCVSCNTPLQGFVST